MWQVPPAYFRVGTNATDDDGDGDAAWTHTSAQPAHSPSVHGEIHERVRATAQSPAARLAHPCPSSASMRTRTAQLQACTCMRLQKHWHRRARMRYHHLPPQACFSPAAFSADVRNPRAGRCHAQVP